MLLRTLSSPKSPSSWRIIRALLTKLTVAMSPGSTMVAFMIVSKVGKVGLMEGCGQSPLKYIFRLIC